MRLFVAALGLSLVMACEYPLPPAPDGVPDGGADGGAYDPQLNYRYDACTDPNPSWGCPNSGLYSCALRIIEAKHNACTGDPDCTVVSGMSDCQGAFSCPPRAVNKANEAAFHAEAQVEITAYCDGGVCWSSGSCAFSYSHRVVRCISNRCTALPNCDGGICP